MRPPRQLRADLGRTDVGQARDLVRNQAQRAGDRPPLEKEVGANAGDLSEREAEVDLALYLELVPAIAHEPAGKGRGVVRREVPAVQRQQLATDSGGRGTARRDQQVGTATLRDRYQERADVVADGLAHGEG